MLHLVAAQRAHLEETLHGEHFRHRVGNRRARGEDDASARVAFLDELDFEEQVERPLAGGLRQACYPVHLRDVKHVLELVRLVDKEPVDAEFLESQSAVLAVAGSLPRQ